MKDTGGICVLRARGAYPQGQQSCFQALEGVQRYCVQLPREKHGAWLQDCAEVIQRLNVDYFKPWFLMKKGSWIVEGLGDTTYDETVLHLM